MNNETIIRSLYFIKYDKRVVPIYSTPDGIRKDVKTLASKKLSILSNYKIHYVLKDKEEKDQKKSYKELIEKWENDIDQEISEEWIDVYAINRIKAIKNEEIVLIEIEKEKIESESESEELNKNYKDGLNKLKENKIFN